MTHEDLQAVSKALSVIIGRCNNKRIIIEPCEKEDQPKKKLTFSERQKIVREYQDWCLLIMRLTAQNHF